MFKLESRVMIHAFAQRDRHHLHRLLFEPNDEELEQKIYDTIDNSIRTWLPQLSIKEINIEATDEMKNNNSINKIKNRETSIIQKNKQLHLNKKEGDFILPLFVAAYC